MTLVESLSLRFLSFLALEVYEIWTNLGKTEVYTFNCTRDSTAVKSQSQQLCSVVPDVHPSIKLFPNLTGWIVFT